MPVTSRTFKNGNSEAVRLPKDVGFGIGVELEIERSGEVVTMRPKRPSIAEMIDKLNALPKPSGIQKRVIILPPRRKGL